MDINLNKYVNTILGNDLGLPSSVLKSLESSLIKITLEPGEKLNDFYEPLPGLFLIEKGELRLISLDEKKDIFTVKVFSTGEVIGANELLRGVFDQSFSASTKLEGFLLPSKEFFKLIITYRDIYNSFSGLNLNEFFSSILNCKSIILNQSRRDFLAWAKKQNLSKFKVLSLKPGEHIISNLKEELIISSCNIENVAPGTLINKPTKLNVIGKIPGRVICLPFDYLKVINSSKMSTPEKEKVLNKVDNLDFLNRSRNKEEFQSEALEDWYGRLNKKNSYPFSKGSGTLEESLACLRMLAQHFDLPFRRDLIRSIIKDHLQEEKSQNLKFGQFAALCELIGLRSIVIRNNSLNSLNRIPLPALTFFQKRPIILWEYNAGKFYVGDPSKGLGWNSINSIFESNEEENNIEVLYCERFPGSPKARFGLSWFLPVIIKHRNSLFQVVIASFFAQLLGLFNPLLIQQIIDAVINQGNLASLNVLGSLLVFMAVGQALISSLRTFLFADTTNRIDMSLGASIINHLLRLPLNYFSKRPVGEVSSRVSELERIRGFLTGTALTVILDSTFSIIYIAVMLMYSARLTLFSLAVIPLFVLLSFFVSPIIRSQLRKKALANARVNSHLVEILSGIETVKGQGMELQSEWRWEKFYSDQIQAGFQNVITSTSAGAASNFLQQVSGLIVIWAGALIVLKGEMTLGQLIAFRILSGYVTGPLLRMASLWQNFQETIISLERLSDIVDHQKEIEIAGQDLPPLPTIQGRVQYEKVDFGFQSNSPKQLSNINFEILEGSFVGIAGSSGSGKSTLLKLLTRFFYPSNGTIRIDGNDISKVDLYSLRSQVGIVPQDTLLFDGNILENIAFTKPEATFEEIKKAAKIACAHDFIQSLPAGYSTQVGEKGSSLSGGQRQRIAIARMVLKKPKLLVLDEATSSLDSDTEYQVTCKIAEAFKDKTVFFISHRLSSLKKADQILVLHKGVLIEKGDHEKLIKLNGRYATLYKQQDHTK